MELTPQQLADTYLDECRRVNGDEYADATRLSYHKGWFKLISPWFYAGHYHRQGEPWVNNMRRAKLEQAVAVLKTRKDYRPNPLTPPPKSGTMDVVETSAPTPECQPGERS